MCGLCGFAQAIQFIVILVAYAQTSYFIFIQNSAELEALRTVDMKSTIINDVVEVHVASIVRIE
jgi:hypothetical protein